MLELLVVIMVISLIAILANRDAWGALPGGLLGLLLAVLLVLSFN